MDVLRVLVFADVGDYVGATLFGVDEVGYLADDVEKLVQKHIVVSGQAHQRLDVAPRRDHNVRRPRGTRVVEGDHVLGFDHLPHRRPAGQHLIAVEIVRHGA